MKKLVLFDIDGTLLLTQGAGMRCMERAGQSLFGPTFSFKHIDPSGWIDPLIYRAAAEHYRVPNAAARHDDFRNAYLRELTAELQANPKLLTVMPGILPLLKALSEDHRVVLGLLTGNYAPTAKMKLELAGITWSWFKVGAFGEDGPDRPSLVPFAMRQGEKHSGRPLTPRDVIVVGDTPRDVDCAKVNGCRALAVATGPFGVDVLRATEADTVVPNFSDPAPLYQMIASNGET